MVIGLRRLAVVLEPLPSVNLSRDPDDNPVLTMTVAATSTSARPTRSTHTACSAAARGCRCTGGPFALSTHAWDEPVETLLALADPGQSHLLLPRLGEAVEPVERRPATPWWRTLRGSEVVPAAAPAAAEEPAPAAERRLAEQLPWPLD